MPVLYLDVLVVLNAAVDYLLLSLTAQLLHRPVRRLRLAAGAVVGGLSACQILWSLPFPLPWLLSLFSAAVMLRVAFAWHTRRLFVRQLVTFYGTSLLLSGLVGALWYATGSERLLVHGTVIYGDLSPWMLTLLAVLSYGAVWLYERLVRCRTPDTREYLVTVNDGCGPCECRALHDTGLHLREPFSGQPVIVIGRRTLAPYLSDSLRDALCAVTAGHAASPAVGRWRLIPYRTVGGNGLLPAFVPAQVTVRVRGEPPRDISGVYVALSDEPDRGDYTALIGSDITQLA